MNKIYTYWQNQGKYQALFNKLKTQLEHDKTAHNRPILERGVCPWAKSYSVHERAFWEKEACYMLLNTMMGIYYACHNYDESPSEAIRNGRILGFKDFNDVRDLLPYDTPDLVIEFLKNKRKIEKERLEKVFDTVIEYLRD